MVLSGDCSKLYTKRAVSKPYHKPAYVSEEAVLVKFSTTEGCLPQNTSDIFAAMRGSIEGHFGSHHIV